MRRNFEELRSFLHAHYPALAKAKSVQGELYPPPAFAQTLATFASYAQMTGFAILLGGSFIFDKLGVVQPSFVSVLRRNPLPTFVGLFFLNSACSSFSTTGAFEVSIDGEVVFSRLAGEGNFPTGRLLLSEMEKRGLRSVRPS